MKAIKSLLEKNHFPLQNMYLHFIGIKINSDLKMTTNKCENKCSSTQDM